MPARTLRRRAAPAPPYDPAYDPLVSPPGQGQDYAPTYWVATAGSPPQGRPGQWRHGGGRGRGRLGLHRAVGGADAGARLRRARRGAEANRAVWGCTSRNGGQGQNASGRLYRSQWIQRWGWTRPAGWTPRSARVSNTGRAWWRRWTATRSRAAICTPHRQKKMAFLENESRVMREVFGYDTRMLSKDQLRERYVDDHGPWARCWSRTAWACIRSSWPTATCARRARWARASIRPARCWAARRTALTCCRPRRHGARAARGLSPPAATRRRA